MTGADRPTFQTDSLQPAEDDLGRLLRHHFGGVADERAVGGTVSAISSSTARVHPRPAWQSILLGRWPIPPTAARPAVALGRRPFLATVIIVLLSVALLGAVALVGSFRRDLLESRVLPPPTVEPARAAVPSPSAIEVADGETAPPRCSATEPQPVADGPLPAIGAPAVPQGTGVIAAAADGGIVALDPAGPPPPFGLWTYLVRFPAESVWVSSFSWSPDGRWLAAVVGRRGRPVCADIYLVPADGGVARRLTDSEPGTALGQPTWSADGRWLAFLKTPGVLVESGALPGPAAGSIEAVRLDGDLEVVERRRLVEGSDDWMPSWSSRGELAVTVGPDATLTIKSPGAPDFVTMLGVEEAAWSPAGDYLALRSNEGDTRAFSIFKVHGDGIPGESTFEQLPAWKYGVQPRFSWSADGRHLAYVTYDESKGSPRGTIWDVGVDRLETDVPVALATFDESSDEAILINGLTRSSDGQWIAFILDQTGGDDGVWVMRADGSEQRRISGPTDTGLVTALAWQPAP